MVIAVSQAISSGQPRAAAKSTVSKELPVLISQGASNSKIPPQGNNSSGKPM
jgi:hypothetical protein